MGKSLFQVSKVVKAQSLLGGERDVFYVQIGGFDSHKDVAATLDERFTEIDDAIAAFETEMKDIGVWDGTVILSASEFGRTLRSNGVGTDHAWGGNHFMVGGAVRGKQFHGQYPTRLDEDAPLNVRTGGRILPTTSWEMVWNGIATWFGVEEKNMGDVLPNRANFPNVFTMKIQITKITIAY